MNDCIKFNYDDDIFNLKNTDQIIICNFCNDIDIWDNTFTYYLGLFWCEPKIIYLNTKNKYLGDVTFIRVNPNTIIANMIVFHDVKSSPNGTPPIRYGALRAALSSVNKKAYEINASVHIPKYILELNGCDDETFHIILSTTMEKNTTVYCLTKNN